MDRLWRMRDTLMADARFQRFSADFPLSRPIARRESKAAFDLCAGFVYSQILMACVRLNLFELLAGEPKSLEAIAARTALPIPAAERLLDAAVSLRLADKRSGGRYGLGAIGAAMRGNAAITNMIAHHDMLYRDLADPVALLRGTAAATEVSRFWAYARPDDHGALQHTDVSGYTQLMATSLDLIAGDILDAAPIPATGALLDIGGGDGTFLSHVARRHAGLTLSLLDLPAVAQIATDRFSSDGLSTRCTAIGGDMFTHALAPNFDVVTLVRVALDHDDVKVLTLLQQAASALRPGGQLLIAEPQAGVPGAEAMGAAYFGFYLLAMGQGRARSFNEIGDLLRQAGFVSIRAIATRRPLLVGLVAAAKKSDTGT